MTNPPRVVESLLKGLGADPYLTEIVLGDLAEEFAERNCFDGEVEARRWYRREALRAVPHLLRSALSRLRSGDAPRLIGIALFSWLALLPVSLGAYALLSLVVRGIGIDWTIRPLPQNTGFLAVVMVAMPLAGLAGGYIAAWRNARAPLIGAAAFGVVLTSINLLAGMLFPSPITLAFRTILLAMFNAAAIAGGAIWAARHESSSKAARAAVSSTRGF